MNFGTNLWNYISGNLQPLVLMGLACTGLYFFIEKKASKIIGVVVIGIIVVGFVFFTSDVKDLFGSLFKEIFK